MIGPGINIWTPASPQGGPWGADHVWESATHPMGAGNWVDSVGGAVLVCVGTTWTRTTEGVAQGGGVCHATAADLAVSAKFFGSGWRTWALVGTLPPPANLFSRETDGGDMEAQMYGGGANWGPDVSDRNISGVWTNTGRGRGTSPLKLLAWAQNMQATPSGNGAVRSQPAAGSAWLSADNGLIPIALASGWSTKAARVFQPAAGTRTDLGNWTGRILRLATAPGIASLAEIQAWAASLGVVGI